MELPWETCAFQSSSQTLSSSNTLGGVVQCGARRMPARAAAALTGRSSMGLERGAYRFPGERAGRELGAIGEERTGGGDVARCCETWSTSLMWGQC